MKKYLGLVIFGILIVLSTPIYYGIKNRCISFTCWKYSFKKSWREASLSLRLALTGKKEKEYKETVNRVGCTHESLHKSFPSGAKECEAKAWMWAKGNGETGGVKGFSALADYSTGHYFDSSCTDSDYSGAHISAGTSIIDVDCDTTVESYGATGCDDCASLSEFGGYDRDVCEKDGPLFETLHLALYYKCEEKDHKECYSNDVYWYDSCGNRGSKYEDCGSDECESWEYYCKGDEVWKNRDCVDRGCSGSSCYEDWNYDTDDQYVKTCGDGETCKDGTCVSEGTVKGTMDLIFVKALRFLRSFVK